MDSRSRQVALLAVLIVAFAWLIGRQLMPELGGGGGSAPRRAAARVTARIAADAEEIARLRLGALEHKPATYRPGRDPFRFGSLPKPKPKPRPQPKPPAPPPDPDAARRAAEAARARAAPTVPPRPQPPAIGFVFLGSFGLPGREIAVFSDGQEILNAFAGDVVQQEFVVRSIGYESADIGFVNFPEEPAKRLAVGG